MPKSLMEVRCVNFLEDGKMTLEPVSLIDRLKGIIENILNDLETPKQGVTQTQEVSTQWENYYLYPHLS